MNHLAHFFLASGNSDLMVGGFLGDFVKGPLEGQTPDPYHPAIISGIRLHRAIDAFTDQHPIVKKSHRRFNKKFRRFAPIICDIVYDHFLASQWAHYSEETLEDFGDQCYEIVLQTSLPIKVKDTLLRMQKHNALASYAREEFIDHALINISERLKRSNPLASGFRHYEEIRAPLKEDFQLYMPALIAFVTSWRASHFDAN